MVILLLLALVLCGCFSGVVLLRRQFEEVVPIYASVLVLFLFLSAFLRLLRIGMLCFSVLTAASFAAALVMAYRKGSLSEAARRFFSPGLFVWILLSAVSLFAVYGKPLYSWDEFSHWGLAVKVMLHENTFATAAPDVANFASYPPGLALFEGFFAEGYLFLTGEYAEWVINFAYVMFGFSFLVPAVRLLPRKAPAQTLFAAGICFLIPLFWWDEIFVYYVTIYADAILGILFGSGLWMILFRRNKDLYYALYIACVCAMLVLVKDAGLFLAVSVGALFAADWLCRDPEGEAPGGRIGAVLLAEGG